jgi:predicted phosphodiesterase
VGRQLEDTQTILDVLPNVRFAFPDKLMESMTVQLDTARIGLVHGHQFGSPDKAGDWWAKQDHGRMPTWDADLLLVGHWHSYRQSQSGDGRWIIIGPASDPGSSWFSNIQGERATAGMNAFVLESKRIRFQEIL